MAGPQELPGLVSEFVDLAKAYLRQETVEPAKRLGRYAAFSMGAGLIAAIAVIPLAVAGNRFLIHMLPGDPSHQMWSGLGYVISAIVALGLAGIVVWAVTR